MYHQKTKCFFKESMCDVLSMAGRYKKLRLLSVYGVHLSPLCPFLLTLPKEINRKG